MVTDVNPSYCSALTRRGKTDAIDIEAADRRDLRQAAVSKTTLITEPTDRRSHRGMTGRPRTGTSAAFAAARVSMFA
jgi:hypothetical protein